MMRDVFKCEMKSGWENGICRPDRILPRMCWVPRARWIVPVVMRDAIGVESCQVLYAIRGKNGAGV